jgi:3-methyl-2-oxobutanoate hydroxymethyltransferase
MTPAPIAKEISEALTIPTIGIGAGPHTDGQILVWTDFAGMHGGAARKFVRKYADLREQLTNAAKAYRQDVASGDFPNQNEGF